MSRKKWWVGNDVSGSAPMPSPMIGLTDMVNGQFRSSAGVGWPGGLYSWYIGTLFQIDEFVAGQTFFTYYFSGLSGGNLLYQISPTQLTFLVVEPPGVYNTTPFYTMSDSELGKVMSMMGVVDAVAAVIRLYVNGVEIGNTSVSGYLQTTTESRLGSWTLDSSAIVYGAVYGTDGFPPTASQIMSWHLACKTNRRVMPMTYPYPTNGLWRVKSNSLSVGVPDLVGTANLSSIVGIPKLAKTFSRFAA